MATYFFSRISINIDGDYLKKIEYLYSILTKAEPIIYRKDYYRTIDILIRKIGVKSYLTGRLIKYASQHSERILNDDNQIEDVILRNPLLADIKFMIDANEMMFIYQEDRSYIPRDSVAERLLGIINENTRQDIQQFPISITSITESYTFLNRIKEIKELKKITIKLHPSNPNNRDRWKKLDEKLKADNITDYKEVQENKTKGESIIVDDETIGKIMMGEDGYGETKAEGFDQNGEWTSIKTNSNEVQAKADIPSEDDIAQEIQNLQKKIDEIKNKPDIQG